MEFTINDIIPKGLRRKKPYKKEINVSFFGGIMLLSLFGAIIGALTFAFFGNTGEISGYIVVCKNGTKEFIEENKTQYCGYNIIMIENKTKENIAKEISRIIYTSQSYYSDIDYSIKFNHTNNKTMR